MGCYGNRSSLGDTTPPNPNPRNFKILFTKRLGNHVLVLVNYPDCTNYKGNKLLLLKNMPDTKLENLHVLDPHFIETDIGGSYSAQGTNIVARFVPTPEGIKLALKVMALL